MENTFSSSEESTPAEDSSWASGRHSDFSIDFILSKDGPGSRRTDETRSPETEASSPTSDGFAWLQCTRYRPPKLQRSRRKEGGRQRRQPGRNPRIPFSGEQVALLEERFRIGQYLGGSEVARLSSLLCLSETRVKIWFQNRRARERREQTLKSQGLSSDSSPDKREGIASSCQSRGEHSTKSINNSKTLPTSQTSAFIPYSLRLTSASIFDTYSVNNYRLLQDVTLEPSSNKHRTLSICK